ncbi:thioesterase II family protein [Micromonospora sp. DT4]|uniref:thioesterase II family protein n=1 Tax=Micromonospora sp. DT4 TaxID=3393438 RepID=UPI003CEBC4AE
MISLYVEVHRTRSEMSMLIDHVPVEEKALGNGSSAPPTLTVFGFPAAGGSSAHFTRWRRWLPAGVTVEPVELPGHGTRRQEPAIDEWSRLVATTCDTLRARVSGPYVLAGHSFGALLAYEVAATLPRTGPGPALLIAAGRNGPTAGLAHRPLHALDDDRLIESLRRLGGTPANVLAEPALMRLALPVLRTDLRLAETYARPPRPALACPIAAVVGRHDRMADAAGALAWQQETVDRFDLTVVDGGHFILDHPQVIAAVTARTTELLRPEGRPGAGTTSG